MVRLGLGLDSTPDGRTVRGTRGVISGSGSVVASGDLSYFWTPAQVTTALWLDAMDASTISLNGSSVSQWSDKSGNNRHAVQGNASYQPVYDTANGRLNFTTQGYFDMTNSMASVAKNISSMAIFAVCQYTDVDIQRNLLRFSTGASSTVGRVVMGCDILNASDNLMMGGRRLDTDSFQAVTVGTTNLNEIIQCGHFDWSNARAYHYINGSVDASSLSFQTAGNTSNTDSLSVVLGASSSIGGNRFNGYLRELLAVTGTLTADTRQKIEGYLAHKWGLTANLAAGHPYKTERPLV